MMNKGIKQSVLATDLHSTRSGKYPSRDIADLRGKVAANEEMIKHYSHLRDSKFDMLQHAYTLPIQCFKGFTKEDMYRLKFSTVIMMNPTVDSWLDEQQEHEVIQKIANSQWRYGFGQDWNTLVLAYEGIRRFDFGIKDVEVRLDMTTGCNEQGYTRHTRTFIDGTLGFLIYFKGVHVLTIGFSIADKKRVLIQQVQMKQKKGNRWLYKIPCSILDYAIDRMTEAFSGMNVYLCKGEDQVNVINQSYDQDQEGRIKFLTFDAPRLIDFYSKELNNFKRNRSKTCFRDVRFDKLVKK
jgi:hypothetical protein